MSELLFTASCLHPSVAFGMRKALMAEQGKADMEQRIKELEEEKRELEKQVIRSFLTLNW